MTAAAVNGVPALSRRRTGVWVLSGAQYALAALTALCACSALARAADFAGHWYVPSPDDRYTANADVLTGWTGGYFVTFFLPVAPLLAGLGLAVSVALFLQGHTAGRRGLTATLAGSAVAMLLVLVAAVSPAGMSLITWLID
ncbi:MULTISPECIES: hypothetical protein [unclassified Actinoplanes]|uniref:hypothetical protein n=1 Tax=unclassified Actinoplanes TaxID=2626549 RepID=UPI0009C3D1ED|nr:MULTISPECIES: hypothetical protein [unclassified Actinoplanes]SLL99660.1 hypothetical protein ACSP50_2891 [Actinoplanes sp. SE50/110]